MTTYGIDHLATNALLGWLLASRAPAVERDPGGHFVLGYGRPLRGTALALALFSSALLGLGCFAFRDDPRGLALAGGIFGLMWLGSVYLLYDVFFVELRVDERGLRRSGVLGESRLDWTDVDSLRYSTSMHWYSFRSSGAPTVRVSLYRNGLATLADLAASHLDADASGNGLAALREGVASTRKA